MGSRIKDDGGIFKIYSKCRDGCGNDSKFFFLSIALKKLPLSIVYAIWTGIGTAGTVLFGIFYFHEPTNLAHIICVVLILCGIIGLRILS